MKNSPIMTVISLPVYHLTIPGENEPWVPLEYLPVSPPTPSCTCQSPLQGLSFCRMGLVLRATPQRFPRQRDRRVTQH